MYQGDMDPICVGGEERGLARAGDATWVRNNGDPVVCAI